MMHLNKGRQLGRNSAHRRALKRNVLTSLFTYGKITTLLTIAKEHARAADKLITIAKRAETRIAAMTQKMKSAAAIPDNPLSKLSPEELQAEINRQADAIRVAHLRRIITELQDKKTAFRVFYDIAPQYAKRNGGYTAVYHLSKRRLKDNAQQAILKLVEELPPEQTAQSKEERKAAKEKEKERKAEINRKKKRAQRKRKRKTARDQRKRKRKIAQTKRKKR